MDKQNTVPVNTPVFPVVDAILLTPPEGLCGSVGICSNTTAPGQILNELSESLRKQVAVIGPLIVSRDGAERMIINALAHPTLHYLILFSEESITFAPSTNLLLALMDGFDIQKNGNYVMGGVAASAHYPSIKKQLFESFKEQITVLPIFMGKHPKSKEIITRYLEWIKPYLSPHLHELVMKANQKDKIYYDVLQELIEHLGLEASQEKAVVHLDPKDFQHLQPPKIFLDPLATILTVPFEVYAQNKTMYVNIKIGETSYGLRGDNPFLMAYSLMKQIGDKKTLLSPLEQLLLGMEMGRVNAEMINSLSFPSCIHQTSVEGMEIIPLEAQCVPIMDKRYYYKVSTKEESLSVMCLAFDVCESVFELISSDPMALVHRLAQENRFEDYAMDILHRMDIGMQLGCAMIAAKQHYSFIQDFNTLFKINTETLPTVVVESDTFLDVHKQLLRNIYTKGITEEHGDPWKGLARTACALAVYRDAPKALETMPAIYRQGEQDAASVRAEYKKQLLRFDHDGTYTYGERTRHYFGFDQLERTGEILKKNPAQASLIQRFDPAKDMQEYLDPETGKKKFTHDPCLTHDIFFIQNQRLHSFHIARAHNTVNAYPENIFGLFDAYATTLSTILEIPSGDLYMLSSRANILLLTEEQRTKKILAEPSKPMGDIDRLSGPYRLGEEMLPPETQGGVCYLTVPLIAHASKPSHPSLARLENYEGVDTVTKAVEYLVDKGPMHNNVTLSEYYAGQTDPQADQLVFFQMTVFGKKIYATMVFMNRSIQHQQEDMELANYLATLLQKKLPGTISLGDLSLFYVAYYMDKGSASFDGKK